MLEINKKGKKSPKEVEKLNDEAVRPYTASWKTVKVRSKRGRSMSVFVPGTHNVLRPDKIWKLNSHFSSMKRHRGSLSLKSDLDMIEESPSMISNSEHKMAL